MTLPLFPTLPGITWSIMKGPVWSTRVMTGASGVEYRAQNWSYPRWKFTIPIEFLRQYSNRATAYAEFATIVGFCNQQAGQFAPWLYNDPSDNTATAQPLGVGTGAQTAFPIVRSFGGFTEPILAVNTITSVTVNGTPTTAYTLSSSYGYGSDTINFNTAPLVNNAIVVTFTFYFVCRFTDDEHVFENFINGRWSIKELNFQSLK